jgi:hypothetical protein
MRTPSNSMKAKKRGRARYCAFDIETSKCPPEGVRDWRPYRPLGIACASTLLGDTNEQLLWVGGGNRKHPGNQMKKHELTSLVEYLKVRHKEGYNILTWNGLKFDFDILAEESG